MLTLASFKYEVFFSRFSTLFILTCLEAFLFYLRKDLRSYEIYLRASMYFSWLGMERRREDKTLWVFGNFLPIWLVLLLIFLKS